MSDPQTEHKRRELAFQNRGEVVEGSEAGIDATRTNQMISLRLDAGIISALRDLANLRSTTVSELLREGAGLVLDNASRPESSPSVTYTITKAAMTTVLSSSGFSTAGFTASGQRSDLIDA